MFVFFAMSLLASQNITILSEFPVDFGLKKSYANVGFNDFMYEILLVGVEMRRVSTPPGGGDLHVE